MMTQMIKHMYVGDEEDADSVCTVHVRYLEATGAILSQPLLTQCIPLPV